MMRHGRFGAVLSVAATVAASGSSCPDGQCPNPGLDSDDAALLQSPVSRHNHAANSSSPTEWKMGNFWCPCDSDTTGKTSTKDLEQSAEKAAIGIGKQCNPATVQGALREIYKAFETIGTSASAPGGILFHGFDEGALSSDKGILRPLVNGEGLPTYRDVADCAFNNRHTCSAWTWMRRDMTAQSYNFPGQDFHLGIIMKADTAWSLTSMMTPTDRDTNDRNACSENTPLYVAQPPTWDGGNLPPCMQEAADRAGVTANDALIQNVWDTGAAAIDTQCKPDDKICRAGGTGGGLQHIKMLEEDKKDYYPWCYTATPQSDNMKGCFSMIEMESLPSEYDPNALNPKPKGGGKWFAVYFGGACTACTSPFVCNLNDPTTPGTPTVEFGPSGQIPQDSYTVGIGNNGEKWAEQYFEGLKTGLTGDIQCSFFSDMVDSFIGATHSMYAKVLELQNNGPRPTWLYADPSGSAQYLQNEIDTFVTGNTYTEQFREENEQFYNSILAITIDTRTCVEQLSFLDNPEYNIPAQGGNPAYTNAEDRCKGYNIDPQKEQQEITKAREQVFRLQGRFSAAARRPIPIINADTQPLVSPNLETLQQALDGKVNPRDFFKPFVPFR